MIPFSLELILLAAILDASGNVLSRSVGGCPPFFWLFTVLSSLIYLSVALMTLIVERPELGARELALIIAGGSLQRRYVLLLQHGYCVGDLSLIYPLSRGTSPICSTLAAIVLLVERPPALMTDGDMLAPFAVVRALTALAAAPVAYFAPASGISILVGAPRGTRLLGKADTGRLMLAASGVVAGGVVRALVRSC